MRFLVDTGFTGSCVFIIPKGGIVPNIDLSEIQELPAEKWIEVASGEQERTFSALTAFKLDVDTPLPVLLMEAEDYDDPILGMQFLEEQRKTLHLDFSARSFYLD
jgi:predicted aspartyl protease